MCCICLITVMIFHVLNIFYPLLFKLALQAAGGDYTLEDDTLLISSNVSKASDFTATKGKPFDGFGLINHCPFFDPTDVEEDKRNKKLWTLFKLSPEELNTNANQIRLLRLCLENLILVNNDLSKIPETLSDRRNAVGKDRSVQADHLDKFNALFGNLFRTSSLDKTLSLKKFDCNTGMVSDLSQPDGFLKEQKTNYIRAVIDVTDNTSTPAEAMRQCAATASNVALRQIELGVPVDDIVVPVIVSNGYQMQFGVVIILKPTFPVFVMISHVLDLTCDKSLTQAAIYIWCIKNIVEKSLETTELQVPLASSTRLALSNAYYHLKSLSDFFCSTGNMQSSLFHYFKIMARLHRNKECRDFVIFPICVREYNDDINGSKLVFPKLVDFQIGLPDTLILRQCFIAKLKTAVALFHETGVAHFDLYLSNIMWYKTSDTEVQLKVVDWDAANFTNQEPLPAIRDRLAGRRHYVMLAAARKNKVNIDRIQDKVKYYDLSLLVVLQEFIDDKRLQATEKFDLDKACQDIQYEFITRYSDQEQVKDVDLEAGDEEMPFLENIDFFE